MTKKNQDGLLDKLAGSRKGIQGANYDDHQLKDGVLNYRKIDNKKPSELSIFGRNKKEKFSYKSLDTASILRVATIKHQAVIKITKYGKSTPQIMSHIQYISRKFELELEDQDGNNISNEEDVENLLETWRDIYFDTRENTRHTVHMVFSTPPGTNRATFNSVIRDTLSEEFKGRNDYLFVQHDDTDHPHAHAVIVLRTLHGKKLDPRKEYLHFLRKKFAEKCREEGIKVDASRRFERGLSGASRRSEMVQMHKHRGIISESDMKLLDAVKFKGDEVQSIIDTSSTNPRNRSIRAHYYNTAKQLYESAKSSQNDQDKRRNALASKVIYEYSKSMPHEPTLPELLKNKVDLKNTISKRVDDLGINTIDESLDKTRSRSKSNDIDLDFDN